MYLPPECLGRVHTVLWQPLQTVADEVDGRADYTNKDLDLEGGEGGWYVAYCIWKEKVTLKKIKTRKTNQR